RVEARRTRRRQHGVPAMIEVADDADLAIAGRLTLEPLHGGAAIADHLIVRDAALGANLGRDVVRGAVTVVEVQVGTDHGVAMVGQAPRKLLVELIPAGHMVYRHNARGPTIAYRLGPRRRGLLAHRPRVLRGF